MDVHFTFEGERLAKLYYLIELINFHKNCEMDENGVICILADAVDEGLSDLIKHVEANLYEKEVLEITKGGTLVVNDIGRRRFIPAC